MTSSHIFTSISRGALAVALTALAPIGAAHAQTEAPAASGEGLGEIVVTASRRAENAKDVPVAVTAIGGEKLDALNSSGLDVRFLAARTPSLQVESSFGRTFPRFYIRGLGNTDFDPNAAQPVSVVLDDVALENPMLKSFPVFDLASVEVLRGPQGTLFGRNTPAGVVKMTSAAPTDHFTGYASASWATYNTVNAEAAIGGPIADGLSFRVSGLLQRRDDWVKNDNEGGNAASELEGYRDMAGRVQLAYEAGDFKAVLSGHYRDLDGSPRVFRANIFKQGSNHFVDGFDKDHVNLDGYTSQSMKQGGGNLRMQLHVDGLGTFFSTTGYEKASVESTGDIDGGGCYPYTGCTAGQLGVGSFDSNTGGVTKPEEFSQEFRFATDDMNGIRLQAGTYFFHQRLKFNEYAYDLAGNRVSAILHNNTNENIGLFASGEAKVTSALTLRAGVRYSHDDKRDTITLDPALAASSISSQLIGVDLPLSNTAQGSNLSWDVSATYALSPDVNLYGRVATGYQGPAIQDRVTFFSVPSVAKKQTTISYEGGIKGAIANMVRFDLSAYYWNTDDLQLTAVGGVGNSARLINVNKAVGYGLEGNLEAQPLDHLNLTVGGSYNFTEIRDKNAFVAVCGSGMCTPTGNTFVDGGTTYSYLDGNDLPQAPRYIANATLRYGIPVGDAGEVFAYTDWAYRSKINYFLYSAAEFRGRSSLEGGLKVGYKSNHGYEIAAFARNITNQIRAVSAIDFNNLTGMINEPRIIGGMIKASF
ncbi:MAG: TonB-dependent receptor [Sphingobium sp.]|nr:MAG: TonB-dependent receptor [Sphingobium sp.]